MAKILIAEDDQFLANAYKLKLSKSNYEVKVVSDGNEALEAVAEFQPDLILLDLIMPNMDGFATLEALQKDESFKKIPVVVASNLGQKEDIDRAKEMGAVDFVIKSDVSIDDIVQKVQSVVGS